MNTLMRVALGLLIVFTYACASVQGDSLLVRAQQVRASLDVTTQTYAKYEYDNRQALWKMSKDFKQAADQLRDKGPLAIISLTKAMDAYKLIKNDSSTKGLLKEIQIAAALLSEGINAFSDAQAVVKMKEVK